MRLSATAEERRLQEELRDFLAAERPDPAALPRALEERMAALRAWQARCYAAGYVGRAWPREFGGGGRPASEQIVVDQELAGAGATEVAHTRRPAALGGARRAGVRHHRRPGRARPVSAALRQRRTAPAPHPRDPLGGRDLVPGLLG